MLRRVLLILMILFLSCREKDVNSAIPDNMQPVNGAPTPDQKVIDAKAQKYLSAYIKVAVVISQSLPGAIGAQGAAITLNNFSDTIIIAGQRIANLKVEAPAFDFRNGSKELKELVEKYEIEKAKMLSALDAADQKYYSHKPYKEQSKILKQAADVGL